ncbi:MAG: hypothetical protein ACI8ZM_001204 [Crocinitomix sp.]|jgi:hypothetical protein
MKLILILLFCFSAINSKAISTDTITVWHLDFNGSNYLDVFSFDFLPQLNVSKDTLTNESTFSIHQAAGCFWCQECPLYFAVFDQNEKLVQMVTAVNSRKALEMSFQKILAYSNETGENKFDFYYSQIGKPSLESARHVLKLTLVD